MTSTSFSMLPQARRASCCGARAFASLGGASSVPRIFDRKVKAIQRAQCTRDADFLRKVVCERVAERIDPVPLSRRFDRALDVGAGAGLLTRAMRRTGRIGGELCTLVELSEPLLQRDVSLDEQERAAWLDGMRPRVQRVCADEEHFLAPETGIERNAYDVVASALSMHWCNDLPGVFQQAHDALRDDGVTIGAMFGGDTLAELRSALIVAEEEVKGGFGVHISPFTKISDVGNLLSRAGFHLITVDSEKLTVHYRTARALMRELRQMGETSCLHSRPFALSRKVLERMEEKYTEMYAIEHEGDKMIPATFDVIYWTAWKPIEGERKAPKMPGNQPG